MPSASTFFPLRSYVAFLNRLLASSASQNAELQAALDARDATVRGLQRRLTAAGSVAIPDAHGNGTDVARSVGASLPLSEAESEIETRLLRRSNDILAHEVQTLRGYLAAAQTAAAGREGGEGDGFLFTPQARTLLEHFSGRVQQLQVKLDAAHSEARTQQLLVASLTKALLVANCGTEQAGDLLAHCERLAREKRSLQGDLAAAKEALFQAELLISAREGAATRDVALPGQSDSSSAVGALCVPGSAPAERGPAAAGYALSLLTALQEKGEVLSAQLEANAALLAELATLRVEVEGHHQAAEALRRTVEDQEAALLRLQGRLQAADAEATSTRGKTEVMRQQLQAAEGRAEEAAIAEDELKRWAANHYPVEPATPEAEPHTAPGLTLHAKLRELHLQWTSANADREELQKGNKRLREAVDGLSATELELRETASRLRADADKLKASERDARTFSAELEAEYERLEQSHKESERRLQDTEILLEAARHTNQRLELDHSDAQRQCSELTAAASALREQVASLETALAVERERSRTQEHELQVSKNTATQLKGSVEDLRTTFDEREKLLRDVEARREEELVLKDQLERDVRGLRLELTLSSERHRTDSERANNAEQRLKTRVRELEDAHQPLRETTATLTERLEVREKELKASAAHLAELQQEHASLARRLAVAMELNQQHEARLELEQRGASHPRPTVEDDEALGRLRTFCGAIGITLTGRETTLRECVESLRLGWDAVEADVLAKLTAVADSARETTASVSSAFLLAADHVPSADRRRSHSQTHGGDRGASPKMRSEIGVSSRSPSEADHPQHASAGRITKSVGRLAQTVEGLVGAVGAASRRFATERERGSKQAALAAEYCTEKNNQADRIIFLTTKLDELVAMLDEHEVRYHIQHREELIDYTVDIYRHVLELKNRIRTLTRKLEIALREEPLERHRRLLQPLTDAVNDVTSKADSFDDAVELLVTRCLTPAEKARIGGQHIRVKLDSRTRRGTESASTPMGAPTQAAFNSPTIEDIRRHLLDPNPDA